MSVNQLVNNVTTVLINPAILLIFGVALVVFIYGLVQFLWAANVGGKDSNTGKKHMLWGVIGMFIMVAAFGILNLIQATVSSLQ